MAELDRMAMGGERPLPEALVEGYKPAIEDNQADDQEENEDSPESGSGRPNPVFLLLCCLARQRARIELRLAFCSAWCVLDTSAA